MALVGYSDSEGSDSETPNVAPVPAPTKAAPRKTNFQKLVDPSAPRKIKVDLPALKPEAEAEAPPAKKARTAGKFGGFNSLLPAPKRANDAAKKGLGSGVNLKTGAEPAFSRERVDPDPPAPVYASEGPSDSPHSPLPAPAQDEPPKEVKPIGNAMKFKPLSVAKKKAPKKKIMPNAAPAAPSPVSQSVAETPKPLAPKPKVSLFSVSQVVDLPSSSTAASEYKPFLDEPQQANTEPLEQTTAAADPVHSNPNSLGAIADDLNLSAAARRQLFGRNKDAAAFANISHLNMDEEYANNQQLRAKGEAVEHRAVKAVAPGKHSLQQLVNVATTQKDALEDAWAQGKRNKAEGGTRYGW